MKLNRDLLAAGVIALVVHAAAYVALVALPSHGETAAPRPREPIAVVLVGAPAVETVRAANEPAPPARAAVPAPAADVPVPADLPVERFAADTGTPLDRAARADAAPAPRVTAPGLLATRRPAAPRPAALDAPALPVAATVASPGALPEPEQAGRTTSIDPPTVLRNDPPTYPRVARRRGHEGTVDLRIHVLADGRSDAVEIKRSSGHPSLDRAAVRAARQWRFEPASDRGRAIAMWIEIPVEFNLRAARKAEGT